MNIAFSHNIDGQAARAALSMSFFDIARRLGQADRTVAWLSSYIGELIAHDGFPSPLPLYRKGKRVTAIGATHRWTRDSAQAWFDSFLPPALAAVIDEQQLAAHAATLDARATAMAERVAA